MATLFHAESRRLYSWWWDSHISPKNSKWLQENLTDMDSKVKTMIKLIEEDADSFARRAEMYYKKRPELMKLVEEFYRAYRALAERYDHATGELRQAHRTMVEVFPNQMPFTIPDDSPTGSSEAEPRTPEMPHPIRTLLEPDDLQKDALGLSSHLLAIKRNGGYSEDSEFGPSKKGLKQLNEMFTERRARKGLNFHGEEKEQSKTQNMSKEYQKQEDEEKGEKIRCLEEEISRLSRDNQELHSQVLMESERASKAEREVQTLHDSVSKLESEKKDAFIQHQLCLERVTNLQEELFQVQKAAKQLGEEVLAAATRLHGSEEKCLFWEKTNKCLQSEYETLILKSQMQEKEIIAKDKELDKLDICMKEDKLCLGQAEAALQSMRNLLAQSEEKQGILTMELENRIQKAKEMEISKQNAEDEVQQIREDNHSLTAQNLSLCQSIKTLEEDVFNLKEGKKTLKEEVTLHLSERSTLQQELFSVEEKLNESQMKCKGVVEGILSVGLTLENFQSSVKDLKDEKLKLMEICKSANDEKLVLWGKLKEMEKLSEINALLENSLSDAHVEIEGLREKFKISEVFLESIQGEKTDLVAEKKSLLSQIGNLTLSIEKLSEKITFLENSLSDVNVELDAFRVKSKSLEESYQYLKEENSNVLLERANLISKVETVQLDAEDLGKRYSKLKGKESCLKEEKELLQQQVGELLVLLDIAKEEHVSFVEMTETKLAGLQNQNLLLQQADELNQREIDQKQVDLLSSEIEIAVLQSSFSEVKRTNLFLQNEHEKHVELRIGSEKLISELKDEISKQQEKLDSLSENNHQLRSGINQILQLLEKDPGNQHNVEDELLFQEICGRIHTVQSALFDSEDEIQCLAFEKSIHCTLLVQLGLEAAHLKAERNSFQQEFLLNAGQLALLESEKDQLLEINKQLREEVEARCHQEVILKGEVTGLGAKLLESQKICQTLSNENCELLEENQSWKKEFCFLRDDKYLLEEEYDAVLMEALTLACISLVFECFGAEKAVELKEIRKTSDVLYEVKSDLEKEVGNLAENLKRVETDNFHLKEAVEKLEDYRCISIALEDHLSEVKSVNKEQSHEINIGKALLSQKEAELLEVHQKLQAKEAENIELHQYSETLKTELDVAERVKEDFEKKIFSLMEGQSCKQKEIACLKEANDEQAQEMKILKKEVEELMMREEHLNFDFQEKVKQVGNWEMHAGQFYKDHQVCSIQAAIFEEKACELIAKYEKEYRSNLIDLENKLSKVRSVSEELHCEINFGKALLGQKESELLEVHQKLQTKEAENIELHQYLEALKKEFDVVEMMNKDLEKKIFALVEDENGLQKEIGCLTEAKDDLAQEMCILKEEVEELKMKEGHLKFELQEKTKQAEIWELHAGEFYKDHQTSSSQLAILEEKTYELIGKYEIELKECRSQESNLMSEVQRQSDETKILESEAAELYRDFQISCFREAILREKVNELAERYNGLEESTIAQRQIYVEERAFRMADIEELKKKVLGLEKENEELRNELTSIMPPLSSLRDSLSSLEYQTLAPTNSHEANNQGTEEGELASCKDETNVQVSSENLDASTASKVLELQRLQDKVDAITNEVVRTKKLLVQEKAMADNKLEAALKEIEELKSKQTTMATVNGQSSSIHPEGDVGPGKHARFQKEEEEISDAKMKDILLDHVSDAPSFNSGASFLLTGERVVNIGRDDQMLALWETAEKDSGFSPVSDSVKQSTSESSMNPVEYHQIESVEEQKFEKELAVDKQEIPAKAPEVSRAGSRMMIERIASDARRLTNLQITIKDLKDKVKKCDRHLSGFEYDSLKSQLKEVEQTTTQVAEANGNLIKTTEEESLSPSRKIERLDETGNSKRRQVSERARRWSEKISRLELQVQRIQFGLLKLEDEFDSKASKSVSKGAGVLLRDYLYSAKEAHKKKKRLPFCACVRPPTQED